VQYNLSWPNFRDTHDRFAHHSCSTHTIKEEHIYAIAFCFVPAILILAITTGFFPLMAQFTTATLGGAVTDASGSAVPGAKVTVQNMNTDLTRSATTTNGGVYRFPILPVGTYRLTVEKEGF